MKQKRMKLKADVIKWQHFSRKGDAIFRSLGREIIISTLSVATLTFAAPLDAHAQTVTGHLQSQESVQEDTLPVLEVTATRLPLPMEQAARVVNVISREEIQSLPVQSVNDVLKYASTVDVRQRGAFGIQTDLSINGGTHDQIVILLNGVNISSPHTGHLAADFPVSVDEIERIEVLEGAASRVYGTSAFSGAINIITRKNTYNRSQNSKKSNLNCAVKLDFGSFGTIGAEGNIRQGGSNYYNNVSVGYKRSDGGTDNSEFSRFNAFYNGGLEQEWFDVDWQLGGSAQNYGANTFYSGRYPNQYEQNRRYIGSVSMKTKGKVSIRPTAYWIRSLDHYQLIKDTNIGENYHLTDVYGLSVNASTDWLGGTSLVGADIRNEGILSTALGKPLQESEYVKIHGHSGYYKKSDNRTNITYFLEHDIILNNWTVSAGVMANMNTALDYRFRLYPGVDISFHPSGNWKFFASWNMAQRMPTFTDLYYKSPTQEGNVGLKPEKASEFSLSANYRSRGVRADARAYYRHETSMIDWIMTKADSVNNYTTYHATNFKINNMGFSINGVILFRELFNKRIYPNSISVNYAYNNQKRKEMADLYASSYALDYLKHKLIISFDTKVVSNLSAVISLRYQKRMGEYVKYTPVISSDGALSYSASTVGYDPYALLNLKMIWTARSYELYLEADNITGKRYYDIGNVRQPGTWIMAGAKFDF